MTIASEIIRIKNNIAEAYAALADRGATLPLVQDSANLVDTIEQIPIIYDNFVIVGTPNVNFRTGEISNFSTSNYLLLPNAFNPANKSWELRMKIKTGSSADGYQKLFRSCISVPSQAGRMGIFFDIHNKHFECYVTSDGTSWLFGQNGSYTVQTNTTYWLKLGWSGTEYYIDYSLDGENYIRDVSFSSTSPLYDGLTISQLGVYTYEGGYHEPFLGTMYLNETKIDVDHELWWSPVGTNM